MTVAASINNLLLAEVAEKRRTVLASSIFRSVPGATQTEIRNAVSQFLSDNEGMTATILQTEQRGDGRVRISLVPYAGGANCSFHCIRPSDSLESADSVWKREIAAISAEIVQARPSLYRPHGGSNASCPEREVKVHVAPAVNPVKGGGPTMSNKLGFQKKPDVAQEVRPTSAKPQPAASSCAVKKPFQIPLDSLDPSPSVVSLGTSSPENKKLKRSSEDVEMTEEQECQAMSIDNSVAPPLSISSSSPKFRDVTIKRKIVVTEYAMSDSGEMVVKDVEKMVEEVVREEVKQRREEGRRAAAPVAKKPAKEPAAGQGKLTSFFGGQKKN